MALPFVKYQGAGNDFVIFNCLTAPLLPDHDPARIAAWCDRRFGVGADGLMLLEPHPEYDFYMRYFNADGHPSTMCGNGGRCLVAYAHKLGHIGVDTHFLAVDGTHRARVIRPDWIELEMQNVSQIDQLLDGYFVETGSPHYVRWHAEIGSVNINKEGRHWRWHDQFATVGGTNVNFVCGDIDQVHIATFERGVEAETLACGTGVTAAALVAVLRSKQTGTFSIPVKARGGELEVKLHFDGQLFSNIWLCGPATYVFEGNGCLPG